MAAPGEEEVRTGDSSIFWPLEAPQELCPPAGILRSLQHPQREGPLSSGQVAWSTWRHPFLSTPPAARRGQAAVCRAQTAHVSHSWRDSQPWRETGPWLGRCRGTEFKLQLLGARGIVCRSHPAAGTLCLPRPRRGYHKTSEIRPQSTGPRWVFDPQSASTQAPRPSLMVHLEGEMYGNCHARGPSRSERTRRHLERARGLIEKVPVALAVLIPSPAPAPTARLLPVPEVLSGLLLQSP